MRDIRKYNYETLKYIMSNKFYVRESIWGLRLFIEIDENGNLEVRHNNKKLTVIDKISSTIYVNFIEFLERNRNEFKEHHRYDFTYIPDLELSEVQYSYLPNSNLVLNSVFKNEKGFLSSANIREIAKQLGTSYLLNYKIENLSEKDIKIFCDICLSEQDLSDDDFKEIKRIIGIEKYLLHYFRFHKLNLIQSNRRIKYVLTSKILTKLQKSETDLLVEQKKLILHWLYNNKYVIKFTNTEDRLDLIIDIFLLYINQTEPDISNLNKMYDYKYSELNLDYIKSRVLLDTFAINENYKHLFRVFLLLFTEKMIFKNIFASDVYSKKIYQKIYKLINEKPVENFIN